MNTIKRILIGIAIFLVFDQLFLGTIGLGYRVPVENQPLNNPVTVADISEDLLTLQDGRQFQFSALDQEELDECLKMSNNQIELETMGSDRYFYVYAKQRTSICGGVVPFAPLFNVPLIAIQYDKYQRRLIGDARVRTKKQRSMDDEAE